MRKKLFAVIMSAMMMITFMPTMSFADTMTIVGHSANFATVDLKLGDTTYKGVPTTRTMNPTTGIIEASADVSYYTATSSHNVAPIYFYDMSALSLKDTLTSTNYGWDDLFGASGVFTSGSLEVSSGAPHTDLFQFTAPDYCTNKTVKSNKLGSLENLTAKIAKPTTVAGDEYKDHEFNLNVHATYIDSTNTTANPMGTATKPYREGNMPTKKISVKAKTVALSAVTFANFKLGTKAFTAENMTTNYNGSEQAISMAALPDVTVAYKIYNSETNSYDDVANPSVKEAGDYEFKAILTKGNDTAEVQLLVKVDTAKIKVGFAPETTGDNTGLVVVYKGTDYKVRDLVKFTNNNGATTSDAYRATAAALVTNKADIEKFFDAAYDVKQDVSALTILLKEGVDLNAVKEANPVMKNFVYVLTDAATLKEVEIEKNDVTACNQTKTFHVKKAKALKAKKTFQLKGDVVEYGAPTYVKKSGNAKITVAKDGIVTVKKGLKKGTYTVKIKVKAVCSRAASGFVTDSKTLKVKVVK